MNAVLWRKTRNERNEPIFLHFQSIVGFISRKLLYYFDVNPYYEIFCPESSDLQFFCVDMPVSVNLLQKLKVCNARKS